MSVSRDNFDQAKLFIFSDIERELQLARAAESHRVELQALGIERPGGPMTRSEIRKARELHEPSAKTSR